MRKYAIRITAALAIAVAAAPGAFSQAEEAPEELTGIAVGEQAPGFSLKDQNGETKALSDLLEDGKLVALVFHRSANW
jgi:cytochrome oxidase Cu insertion factor (SCO1/SenC/PrrC family)